MKIETLKINPVIYSIKCKVNNKIYIGKTQNHFVRIGMHISELLKGKHHCKLLQNDFILYGIDNFIFEILYISDTSTDLSQLEREYIFSVEPSKLYNSNLIENKVVSYDLETGDITASFFNIQDASIKSGVRYEQIYLCCESKYVGTTADGIGFCYDIDKNKIPERLIDNRIGSTHRNGASMPTEARIKISNWRRGRKASEETKKKMSDTRKGKSKSENTKNKISQGNSISVVQINIKTNEQIKQFCSMLQASIETKTSYNSISMCCRGKLKTAGGFIWRYA